jgi:alkylation response protein AidB-like acyl-CoA dehydrogenase
MKIVRHIETLDETLYGGHAEMVFDNCDVPDDAVLGEVDEGFRYAQVCLGPARTTHILLGRFPREVRPLRIYDGPSETHRWAIARRAPRRHAPAATK